MKPILLNNYKDISKYLFGQLLEASFRLLRFMTPVGVYAYLLQMHPKPLKTTAMNTFLTDTSTYMAIAPGVLLVTVHGKELKQNLAIAQREWKKILPTVHITLQCTAYALIIIYFIVRLLQG